MNQCAFRAHFGWWSSPDLLKLAGDDPDPADAYIEDQVARDEEIAALFAEGIPDSSSVSGSDDDDESA